jgi:DinB family protein
MLDFTPVHEGTVTMDELTRHLSPADLRTLTEESIAGLLAVLEGCADEEVVFVPDDPEAVDIYASDPTDRNLAWTAGHMVVHAYASGEEYSSISAELARGVEYHGRSRIEVPWQLVTTVEQCRRKLRESRRMRLAALDMWPDDPDLGNGYQPWRETDWVNCIGIFAWGIAHDQEHLGWIAKIRTQFTTRPKVTA